MRMVVTTTNLLVTFFFILDNSTSTRVESAVSLRELHTPKEKSDIPYEYMTPST